jgi:hypothetical protein
VIPFTNEFQEEVDFIPDHIFGSTRFVNICRDKKYNTFKSFQPIEDFYPKDLWINGEGVKMKLGEITHENLSYPLFFKPFTEKFFTGKLIEKKSDLDKIQLSTSFIPDENEELIWISPPKNIKVEYRFFIFGGEIATASSYKGTTKNSRIHPDHDCWNAVKNILSAHGNIDKGFAMDMGFVDGEYKIVELNNINSSGIYDADTDAFVRYLEIMSD